MLPSPCSLATHPWGLFCNNWEHDGKYMPLNLEVSRETKDRTPEEHLASDSFFLKTTYCAAIIIKLSPLKCIIQLSKPRNHAALPQRY